MSASVLERVQQIIVRIAGAARTPAGAGPDTPLGEGGFWLDSVDFVEVVIACEAEFSVTFAGELDLTPETLRSSRTLGDLILSKGAE
jgi:acyl carrier protein